MTSKLVEAIVLGNIVLAKELFESELAEIISGKIESIKNESKFSYDNKVTSLDEIADIVRRATAKQASVDSAMTGRRSKLEVQSKLNRMKQSWSNSIRAHLPALLDNHLAQMKKRYHLEI